MEVGYAAGGSGLTKYLTSPVFPRLAVSDQTCLTNLASSGRA